MQVCVLNCDVLWPVCLQENIMLDLRSVFDEMRSQFPRLHFLSEPELVSLLSVSRNPVALVPHVRKCFSGVADISFSLPADVEGTGTSLDYSLFGTCVIKISLINNTK